MSTGDSTLMMLLSLNLLLLVFFMLLNSMATRDKRHSDEVLAKVREGYNVPGDKAVRDGQTVPEAALMAWRAGVMSRLQGVVLNRLDLVAPPQQGNAGKVEIELPVSALFDDNGTLTKPEIIRNMAAAAGSESQVTWQVVGSLRDPRMVGMVSALAAENGKAEVAVGKALGLKVIVVPGLATKAAIGVQVQQVGEKSGGTAQGVDVKGAPRE